MRFVAFFLRGVLIPFVIGTLIFPASLLAQASGGGSNGIVRTVEPINRANVIQDGVVDGAEIGGLSPLNGKASVSPRGEFTYNKPLEGTGLSLTYDSQIGNGIAGMGARLSGPMFLSIARYSGKRGINYDGDDEYAVSDTGWDVPAGPNVKLVRDGTTNFYRTANERWERFQPRGAWQLRTGLPVSPAYWVREFKDGTKMYYGGDDNCNADPQSSGYYRNSPGTCRWDGGSWASGEVWGAATWEKNQSPLSGNPRGIFRWHLYKIISPSGILTKIHYVNYNGISYPIQMISGLHMTAPTPQKVSMTELGYGSRQDTSPYPNQFTLRLREVRSYLYEPSTRSKTLLRKYAFRYEMGVSGRSRLVGLQQQGHDCTHGYEGGQRPWIVPDNADLSCPNGTKYPEERFVWGEQRETFDTSTQQIVPTGAVNLRTINDTVIGDVTGDGRDDIVMVNPRSAIYPSRATPSLLNRLNGR